MIFLGARRRGLDISIAPGPPSTITAGPPITRVALLGDDYQDLRHTLCVEPGARVRCGDTLFVDRKYPEVRYAAPATGRVLSVNLGRQRRLQSMILAVEDDAPVGLDHDPGSSPAAIRQTLLTTGLWPAFRTRPFDRTPAPDHTPHAIYIIATDSRPLCCDPAGVIAQHPQRFSEGVRVIAQLAQRTSLCMRSGAPIALPDAANISHLELDGPHPAGLPGSFIHRNEPGVSMERTVWYIGYQDVMRIGELWLSGTINAEQIVSIAGPALARPQLLRTVAGASLQDLSPDSAKSRPRLLSGSLLDGRETGPLTDFLGRFHNQVTVLPGATGDARRDVASAHTVGPMLPLERFERIWSLNVPPIALLRALLIRDTTTALGLGCLALAEEDLALCSYICPGRQNYGEALRATLREIERNA